MKKLLCLILCCLSAALCASAETPLPEYRYAGDEPYLAEICDWLLANEAPWYTLGDVAIPYPMIAAVDDSNPDDILVWGCFALNWYEARDATLFCVSGGSVPGLMHLREKDGVCAVTAFDAVGDGSDYPIGIRRIFGAREGLTEKLEAAMAAREETLLQFVSSYVNENQLDFTHMQDYGWPAVSLITAPDAAGQE